jgi:hypothetical protein
MQRKRIAKPRNPLVVLALFKKAGKHQKTNKALRREYRAGIAQLVEQ